MADYDRELSAIVDELNQSVASPPPAQAERRPIDRGSVDDLLAQAVRHRATDILLVAGSALAFRVDGEFVTAAGPCLSATGVRNLIVPLLTQAQYDQLQQARSLDFRIVRDRIGRFRANVHFQRGSLAASIRLLPSSIPTVDSLHLPASLEQLSQRRQGLILLTGPAGCGKTTTLAALISTINRTRRAHIITIEDPIEYEHPNHQSIVEQIEVGTDTPDFPGTVRSVLRQAPDVILVGEMRDTETISTALTAAETGHLVLSSLHTNDTSQAVSRILDSFPEANQPQIRQQLSLALLAVISQQLIPAKDGSGRYPALEILMGTDAVRNLIRHGQDHQIRTQLITGRSAGMTTMEQSLATLVRSGRISHESALAHCFRRDDLQGYLT